MLEKIVYLLLAAFPLMGSPGPATLSLAAIGASFGKRAGVNYLLGIILGTFGVLALIATGITGLVVAVPGIKTTITILAATYILYLAWRIATSGPVSEKSADAKPPSFPGGFFLAIANPKAFAAIGAVYTGSTIIPDQIWLDSGIKMLTLTMVIIIVNTAWLIFGSLVSGFLRDPRKSRIANIVFAILLVASVVLALI